MNPNKNLIELKLYMNHSKNLIEPKLYMNLTKNLIEPKLYMNVLSLGVYVRIILIYYSVYALYKNVVKFIMSRFEHDQLFIYKYIFSCI
jgi:hypothetical protein